MIDVTKGCVLACPGRSLADVDLRSFGFPVCAVSSAIRCVDDPDLWIFVERPTHPGYGVEGIEAIIDPSITKVTVKMHEDICHDTSAIIVDYPGPKRSYSLAFAIEWLHDQGCRKMIFAGLDLDGVYLHDRQLNPAQSEHMILQHRTMMLKTLKQLFDRLTPRVRFIVLNPSSPAALFMEKPDSAGSRVSR